jgi:hypothetical protein
MAQFDNGSLNGTVSDASRAVVPGARVVAVSAATGVRRQTTTSSAGAYQIPSIPIGVYTVSISKEGFRQAEYKDVELTVGQARTIDAQLAVSAIAEAVQVEAAVAMESQPGKLGGLIEAEQIKEIPVSGRNWASLHALAPGA